MEIILNVTDKGVSLKADQEINSYLITDVFLSAILTSYNHTVNSCTLDQREPVIEHLYDMFNQSASSLLAQFAPHIDMRPDITAEIILEEEQRIISELMKNKKRQPAE